MLQAIIFFSVVATVFVADRLKGSGIGMYNPEVGLTPEGLHENAFGLTPVPVPARAPDEIRLS